MVEESAGRLLACGPAAVLLELGAGPGRGAVSDGMSEALEDALRVAALADAIRDRVRAGELTAVDVVPGARTVLVDGTRPEDRDLLRRLLERAGRPTVPAGPDRTDLAAPTDPTALADRAGPIDLPTVYDGPDLAAVADRWGVSVPEAVARHAGLVFQAAFCGFAPGFAYLAGLPASWSVPRLPQPRTRVPAGSVALAGPWCGVYPRDSPGGWQLLGHTSVRLFDPAGLGPGGTGPALLRPGSRVRFVPVTG